jgi:type VI secretion system protein ImpM
VNPVAVNPLVTEPPGWFGKIACLGDFASRRLDAAMRDAWDQWLSQRMLAMRERDGDAWLEKYLRAPVQYWLQSPEGDAARWHAGTLMPSVDSAGRYFPLVVVQPLARVPGDLRDWVELEARLCAFAKASLETLAESARIDALRLGSGQAFDAALAATGTAADDAARGSSVASWALATMGSQLAGSSVWWTDAGEHRIEHRWPVQGDVEGPEGTAPLRLPT